MGGYLEQAIGFLEGELSGCAAHVARSDLGAAGELQVTYGIKSRQLAAAHLVIGGSRAEFQGALQISADCRAAFLAMDGAIGHVHFATNAAEAIEDAILCGNYAILVRIAELSRPAAHCHGHVTDWAYQALLIAFALQDNDRFSDEELAETLTRSRHSIYRHPASCLRFIAASDAVGYAKAIEEWCAAAPVDLPDSKELVEADSDESQATYLVNHLGNRFFFSGLAVVLTAARFGIETNERVLRDWKLELFADAAV